MQQFWQDCLKQLQLLVKSNQKIYDTWFKVLKPISWDEEEARLVLEAPAPKVSFIRENYLRNIEGVATFTIGNGKSVTVEIVPEEVKEPEITIPELPEEIATDDVNSANNIARREQTGLLPGLTFENYVNGNANQLAVAAAEHVANTIGSRYNPLYIYGGVGLGKTHLMQAIGHRYLDLHPKAKVRCVSAQEFINEYTTAVRESSTKGHLSLQKFDERYSKLDLLLIDDVQSLSGAKGSQAQFYRAFEELVPHNKQLVLTADTYSKNLREIEPRILSRLERGLSVAIEPPEFEMRTAILINKAHAMNVNLPDDVAAFIAKRLKTNVRELEGALQQVVAYLQFQNLSNKEITIDLVRKVLKDQFNQGYDHIKIDAIQRVVADYYQVKVSDLLSKRKTKNIAIPRQIAMYLARELTNRSYPEIGENFGGRDHATVVHAHRKISQDRTTNANLNHELHVLEQNLRG